MADKKDVKSFDKSELLRKAAIDREEYFTQVEAQKREERLRIESEAQWNEEKRRLILDIEDQIKALESSNRFYLNSISNIYKQAEEDNYREVEMFREKIEQNERKITQLRIEIDDITIKKRPI